MLLIYILLSLISFYLLARICDEFFVKSLDQIAKRFNLSSEAAGATLMAFGSSAPELFISLMALLRPGEHEAIGAGTIVGSAIFNILVIIGASLIAHRAVLVWQPIFRDLLFYAAAIVALIIAFSDGQIQFLEAILFVSAYVVYIFAVLNWQKIMKYQATDEKAKEAAEIAAVERAEEQAAQKLKRKTAAMRTKEKIRKKSRLLQPPVFWKKIIQPLNFILEKTFPSTEKYFAVFGIAIIWISFLSWILVESAVGAAHILGIPEVIIGLTILAAGTSIPDLISSLIVARQGRSDMAVTNAVGSNIFDILFGLGLPWTITILIFRKNMPVDTTNLYSSIILLFATIVAISFLFVVKKWNLGRRSGLLLIFLYFAYLIWLIGRNYILIK